MRHISYLAAGAALTVLGATMPAQAQTDLSLARFFGVCDEKSSDVASAVGEACIIEAIIRSFSETDNGVTVTELPADWDSYYDQIKTSMVGGNAADVFVMHKHRIPEFATIGALAEITPEEYDGAGIDLGDFTEIALESVSQDGKHYGVPLDFHAYLWHINMDLMAEAGLVNEDGSPKLPSSPEEMLEHAKIMKDTTGADYLTGFFAGGPANMRMFVALLAQQGVEPYSGDEVNLDTEESRKAIEAFSNLVDAGYVDANLPDENVRAHWYAGDAAIIIDGTWRVNANDAAIGQENVVIENYYVSEHPQLFSQGGAWADTHLWAIPSSLKDSDPEKFDAALQLLAHINSHNVDWARTGHLPVRTSVLESEEVANMSHRSEYRETADIAYYMPATRKYGAVQEAIGRRLVEHYQNGRPIDEVLTDMQIDVEDTLN
ncbi:MAG: extracellular solute-binding protein [Pseudomonadota bacterium]